MKYYTEEFPYSGVNSEMSSGALKRSFLVVMEQKPRRIATISRYLERERGVRIGPESDDVALNSLTELLSSLATWREVAQSEIETDLAGAKPFVREVLTALAPRMILNDESCAMVFDAALLLGDAFCIRYPGAKWGIGAKPKSSVDYGDPVIVGVDSDKYARFEFGVPRDLYGFVSLAKMGKPESWTLTMIMRMRAFSLGLGPDPRLEPSFI